MKIRTLVTISILVLAVLTVIGNCVTRKKSISDEDLTKAYTGTWINEKHDGNLKVQKIVYHSGLIYEVYR